MSLFKIVKKAPNDFWHIYRDGAKEVNISDFEAVLDSVSQTFSIQCKNGSNIDKVPVLVTNVIVIDETDASIEETFISAEALRNRLVQLNYTPYVNGTNADSITGLIVEGTNVTITGTGTLADPYVINSTGGGGSQDLEGTVNNGNIITDGTPVILQNGSNNRAILQTDAITAEATSDDISTAITGYGIVYSDLANSKYTNVGFELPTGNGSITFPDVVNSSETVAMTSDIDGDYLIYEGYLTQTDTDPPVIEVITNTLGLSESTPTSYIDVGNWTFDKVGAFVDGKIGFVSNPFAGSGAGGVYCLMAGYGLSPDALDIRCTKLSDESVSNNEPNRVYFKITVKK